MNLLSHFSLVSPDNTSPVVLVLMGGIAGSQPTHCGHAHTWELAEGSAPWTPWKEAEPTDGDAS